MRHSTTRTHHRELQNIIGIVIFALLSSVAAGWGLSGFRGWRRFGPRHDAQPGSYPPEISGAPASLEDLAEAAKSHRVYGHALVAGGIHSVDELMALMLSDPLLADHYKSFDLTQTRFIVLDHDVPAYVSYRLGHNIYWSSHQTLIHKGELVLTDGSSFIRARCGNRISYIPGLPTNPGEPTDMDIVENLKPEDPPTIPAVTPTHISLNAMPASPVFVPLLPWVPPHCCGAVAYPPPLPRRRPAAIRADEFSPVYLTILGHAVRIPSELFVLALGILLVLGLHFFVWRSQPKLSG